jgi:hypothetical protein
MGRAVWAEGWPVAFHLRGKLEAVSGKKTLAFFD